MHKLRGHKKNTAQYCCVMSLFMRKLHGHRDNTAPVLLVRALPSNGFTCHNMMTFLLPGIASSPTLCLAFHKVFCSTESDVMKNRHIIEEFSYSMS
jgi:hypothetical protein